FRESAALAPAMAAGGFAWIFRETECSGIAGICPVPNRHAWRLAGACGFRVLGRLPGACFYARKGRFVDGVLVSLSRAEWAARAHATRTTKEGPWDSEEA
ncbi:MAG: hypothetical protein K2N07_00185, partial [Desulfovibrio sp.]|nr:hypothetical protein [Desulfovibrio sp.]